MTVAKVEGHQDLEKNLENGVVINTNQNDYIAYIQQREIAQAKDEKIAKLEEQVANLTDLVNRLLESKNG